MLNVISQLLISPIVLSVPLPESEFLDQERKYILMTALLFDSHWPVAEDRFMAIVILGFDTTGFKLNDATCR